jgi:hypothetical protein
MKKIAIAITALLAVAQLNATVNLQSIENPIVSASTNEFIQTGTITELTATGGRLIEEGTGIVRDFIQPGAQIEFLLGDSVTYLLITLPNGRTITKDIRKGQ